MGYTFKYASFPSDRKTAMTNAYNSIILPNEGYDVLSLTTLHISGTYGLFLDFG